MSTRWIYGFNALDAATERCGGEWDEVLGLLGGKGANLANMTRLGVPVPHGAYVLRHGRLPIVQRMIMASSDSERLTALDELLPLQRSDFVALFRAMEGRRVIIRLLDPPLHEFLPNEGNLIRKTTDLKIRLMKAGDLAEVNALVK